MVNAINVPNRDDAFCLALHLAALFVKAFAQLGENLMMVVKLSTQPSESSGFNLFSQLLCVSSL